MEITVNVWVIVVVLGLLFKIMLYTVSCSELSGTDCF